jgi:hypothetical protein
MIAILTIGCFAVNYLISDRPSRADLSAGDASSTL